MRVDGGRNVDGECLAGGGAYNYLVGSSPSDSRQIKKCPAVGCHRGNQEAAIEKQVPHFAACFRNQQAAVARRAMGRAITAPVVGLVVGTYGIIRADCRACKSASQDTGNSRRDSHEGRGPVGKLWAGRLAAPSGRKFCARKNFLQKWIFAKFQKHDQTATDRCRS